MNRRKRRTRAKEPKGAGKEGKAANHGFKGEQLAGEGKIDEAIEAFRQAVSIDPQLSAAHHNLGILLRRQGFLDEAIESYTRATSIQPDYVDAHYNLGNALLDLGNPDAAVASYQKAVAIKPDFTEAHNNLGNAFIKLGKLDESLVCYQNALAIEADYVEAHKNLGNALLELGKLEDAVASYRKAVAIKPDFTEAHNNLGVTLEKLGRLDEAIASYHKILSINPNLAEAHYNLGNALLGLGHLDEAFASHQKALTINPDYAEAHNSLGTTLEELGRLDEAIASYHKAVAIKPDFAEAHKNLSGVFLVLGRMDEAIASCHKALAIKSDYAEAHCNLAEALEKTNRTEALREAVAVAKRNCPGHPRLSLSEAQLLNRDGDFVAARAVLEATGDAIDDACFLSARAHLLGKLCDRLDDTEAAYNYFREGNHQCRDTSQAKLLDGKHYLARVDVLAKRFTAGWIADWRRLESSDNRSDPVFLVGFPRSGTTLLDTILRSHPAISVIEERPAVKNAQDALGRLPGGHPDGLAGLEPAQLVELRQIYFAELDKYLEPEDRSSIVVDKLPLNLVEAGFIHRIFPEARFVFAERHPCDCVLSCFMQNFSPSEAMVNFLDLEDAARLYDKVMTLWQQYQTVLPLEVHTLRYESLIGAFDETLAPLLDFLGVDWDDGVRNYTETARNRRKINTASYNQVTQPLYERAQGRWQRYREHMQPVLPALLPWARRFGYDE